MIAKLAFLCVVVAIVVAQPVPDEPDSDEDLPVYTEKVRPNAPTKAPRPDPPTASELRRYEPKKLRTAPKKAFSEAHDLEPKRVYRLPKSTLRKSQRDIRRTSPEVRAPLRGEYAVQKPTYAAVPERIQPRRRVKPAKSYEPLLKYKPVPQVQYEGYGAEPVKDYALPPRASPSYGYEQNSYDDKPQPYSFGYELKDDYGSTQMRQEQDDGYGNKKGSYGYTDGYGIYRQVDYIADKDGFRATVKTNEPGTDNQDPADVDMISEVSHQNVGRY